MTLPCCCYPCYSPCCPPCCNFWYAPYFVCCSPCGPVRSRTRAKKKPKLTDFANTSPTDKPKGNKKKPEEKPEDKPKDKQKNVKIEPSKKPKEEKTTPTNKGGGKGSGVKENPKNPNIPKNPKNPNNPKNPTEPKVIEVQEKKTPLVVNKVEDTEVKEKKKVTIVKDEKSEVEVKEKKPEKDIKVEEKKAPSGDRGDGDTKKNEVPEKQETVIQAKPEKEDTKKGESVDVKPSASAAAGGGEKVPVRRVICRCKRQTLPCPLTPCHLKHSKPHQMYPGAGFHMVPCGANVPPISGNICTCPNSKPRTPFTQNMGPPYIDPLYNPMLQGMPFPQNKGYLVPQFPPNSQGIPKDLMVPNKGKQYPTCTCTKQPGAPKAPIVQNMGKQFTSCTQKKQDKPITTMVQGMGRLCPNCTHKQQGAPGAFMGQNMGNQFPQYPAHPLCIHSQGGPRPPVVQSAGKQCRPRTHPQQGTPKTGTNIKQCTPILQNKREQYPILPCSHKQHSTQLPFGQNNGRQYQIPQVQPPFGSYNTIPPSPLATRSRGICTTCGSVKYNSKLPVKPKKPPDCLFKGSFTIA